MEDNHKQMLNCLVQVHQTLSICSKCYECCNEEEKTLYGELSEDAARMIKKIKKHMSNNE